MFFDCNDFFHMTEASIRKGEAHREVVRYAQDLRPHFHLINQKWKRMPELAELEMGERILAHAYGELLAIRFRDYLRELLPEEGYIEEAVNELLEAA
jgi:hypothetical protein